MQVGAGAKEQKHSQTAKKSHFTLPHTLERGLVYNGGHVCGTLLLLAAIRALAQCQISGGITNGVNYNIFWCMGKFRHWPGVMTIPQEVLRKSVRVMCWCCLWVCTLCNKMNKELTGAQWFTAPLPTINHLNARNALTSRWSFLFAKIYFSCILLWYISSVTQTTERCELGVLYTSGWYLRLFLLGGRGV